MGWAPTAATSAAAALPSKKSKHPRSYRGEEQPTKRHREGVDGGAPKAQREGAVCDDGPKARREAPWSSQEKDGINKMLLSLLPPGSNPHKVLPLPESILRVLQENQTGHGGGDGDLEIDVHALGDDALGVIKNRVGAYLADRVRRDERVLLPIEKEEAPTRIRLKAVPSPSEVVTKKAQTWIPPKAAPPPSKKELVTKIAPTRIPPKAAPLLPAPPNTPSTDTSSRDGRQLMYMTRVATEQGIL